MNMTSSSALNLNSVNKPEAESISHKWSSSSLNDFTLALSIWAKTVNLTQTIYSALLEVLQLLMNINCIKVLSDTLNTLKHLCCGQLPLLSLKAKHIEVEQEQQSSLSAEDKSKSTKITVKMIFFESVELIHTILSSKSFCAKQHCELTEIVNKLTEFYHSLCWSSSIHAFSGDFARYSDRRSVFSSDFVYFCHHNDDSSHLEQVIFVEWDRQAVTVVKEDIVLLVQEIQAVIKLFNIYHDILCSHAITLKVNELILLEDQICSVTEKDIVSHQQDIYRDWTFDDCNINSHLSDMFNNQFFLKQILNVTARFIQALNLSASLQAELKIEVYRQDNLKRIFGHERIISLPFTMFINEFELYQNFYQSLMRIYIISADLNANKQIKQSNVFVLTLEPHDFQFDDVIAALQSALFKLNQELIITINNEEVFVCAYTLAFVEDMPQQQANKKLMNQNTNYGCEFCLIYKSQKANLNFDIMLQRQYHHQIMTIQHWENQLTASVKDIFFQSTELHEHQTSLIQFAPALNIIQTHSPDMTHSVEKCGA